MREVVRLIIATSFVALLATSAMAQGGAAPPAAAPQQPLPPATKLEGFKPAAGSVLTVGYDELGGVGNLTADVRDVRDAKGGGARGLLVTVRESQYREETSFVDADEIPDLLKGLDALLDIKTNPTQFKMFEVRYTTRGELQLTAFSNARGAISYAVQAGRTLKAQTFLNAGDMPKLREMFAAGLQKLTSMGVGK